MLFCPPDPDSYDFQPLVKVESPKPKTVSEEILRHLWRPHSDRRFWVNGLGQLATMRTQEGIKADVAAMVRGQENYLWRRLRQMEQKPTGLQSLEAVASRI